VRVLYDRQDSAFSRLTPEGVDWKPIRSARIVHISGVTPALGDGPRSLVTRALREAATVSFDVNYRAALWAPDAARRFLVEILPLVRYLFLGLAEARTVFEMDGGPERILQALALLAPSATIALLQGEEGSLVLDGGQLARPTRRYPVQVVDPIGAGDAYVAGFLWAVLRGRPLQEAVDAGAAVAALKCSTWGDMALVSVGDVDEVLGGGPDVRR
jgi:2-dehydro-3-deoxygluconokinase